MHKGDWRSKHVTFKNGKQFLLKLSMAFNKAKGSALNSAKTYFTSNYKCLIIVQHISWTDWLFKIRNDLQSNQLVRKSKNSRHHAYCFLGFI